MRKYLLPPNGRFYKANLHSHSSCSDGGLSPEAMKAKYKQKGYSVLAVSDHDALHSHNELTEDDFLMLTAYEISIRDDADPTPHAFRKVVDINLLAKEPDNLTQIGYHPETVQWLIDRGKMTQQEVDDIKYAGELRDLKYYPANMNKIIKTANENGFLVTLNHTAWSNTNFNDYGTYEGLWGIEVYNHSCYANYGLHNNEAAYADILRTGKRIFAVATDDNHNHRDGTPNCDSFGGFIMIKSEKLDYPSIISALEKGDFYASCGPEIYTLYYEDGYVHIECSDVCDISMLTLGRRGVRVGAESGKTINSASFKIDPEMHGLVRFRITDKNGKNAYTNPYYVDEFDDTAVKRRVII